MKRFKETKFKVLVNTDLLYEDLKFKTWISLSNLSPKKKSRLTSISPVELLMMDLMESALLSAPKRPSIL